MSISFFADCTVLITGASAGIGREFARQLAPAVSTMILVARRNDRLEALELELKIINPGLDVFSRQLDLRDHAGLEKFCNWLGESGLTVDLLVNNAGLGDHGAFIDSDWERVSSMLQVNIESLTYLTYRILPSMRKSGCGAILNISSIASLMPVPHMGVYAATKAYVTSFSESLRAELRAVNISVTALCPGPVVTEFEEVADRTGQNSRTSPTREFFTVPVQEIVRQGLEAVSRDKARVIPGISLQLAMAAFAFIPMFIKRLILNAHAVRQTESSKSSSHPDYEVSGRV
jgi:short-subunit dehydrogenase